VAAVERALAARGVHAANAWPALVRRVMRLDRGWERPARRYEQLYRSLAQ
jgi:starch synthase